MVIETPGYVVAFFRSAQTIPGRINAKPAMRLLDQPKGEKDAEALAHDLAGGNPISEKHRWPDGLVRRTLLERGRAVA